MDRVGSFLLVAHKVGNAKCANDVPPEPGAVRHSASSICAGAASAQQADLILYHGKMVTVDPGFRIADSLALRHDRIAGVGTREEVKKLAAPNTSGLILKATDASMYEFDHLVLEMEDDGRRAANVQHSTSGRPVSRKRLL